ncbi:hypothetical protein [Vibrio lentus]|uniref:Chromosome partitioning protein ParA n=1 Tax=Vibrio lentus TaxID=136468 RepID=A0A855IU27_9VIBR|nr:hypothetical protein [Vibrio lentus]PMM61275.1 hypothetical protein BCT50_20855 [Vibrio lentus]
MVRIFLLLLIFCGNLHAGDVSEYRNELLIIPDYQSNSDVAASIIYSKEYHALSDRLSQLEAKQESQFITKEEFLDTRLVNNDVLNKVDTIETLYHTLIEQQTKYVQSKVDSQNTRIETISDHTNHFFSALTIILGFLGWVTYRVSKKEASTAAETAAEDWCDRSLETHIEDVKRNFRTQVETHIEDVKRNFRTQVETHIEDTTKILHENKTEIATRLEVLVEEADSKLQTLNTLLKEGESNIEVLHKLREREENRQHQQAELARNKPAKPSSSNDLSDTEDVKSASDFPNQTKLSDLISDFLSSVEKKIDDK